MRKLLALAGLLALAACGTTPAQRVYTAKTAFEGATLAVTHYAEDLPRCSPTQAPPCSQQSIIDQANKAAHEALPVLNEAEDMVRKAAAAKANPLAPPVDAAALDAQAKLAAAKVAELQAIAKGAK